MHSRIFSPKIGFICGMRKSASPRSAALPACRSRAAEKAQRQNDQSDTADRRAAETAYSCLSGTVPRMSASIDRTERPIGKADRPHRKTTCESPAVARRHHIRRHSGRRTTSTEKAPEFSFAARPKRTGEATAGPRTETSAPRSERPCDLGSEKPAQSPCENSCVYFRIGPDFRISPV